MYMVIGLMRDGSLFDMLVKMGGKPFKENQACNIFAQIMDALMYVHGLDIAHRDLKPENILLQKDQREGGVVRYVCKVADFGVSRHAVGGSGLKTYIGTPAFIAPEVTLGTPYGLPADMYSSGILLHMLLVGARPVSGVDVPFDTPAWVGISDGAKEVVQGLLTRDPALRPTAKDIRKHAWMAPAYAKRGAPVAICCAAARAHVCGQCPRVACAVSFVCAYLIVTLVCVCVCVCVCVFVRA